MMEDLTNATGILAELVMLQYKAFRSAGFEEEQALYFTARFMEWELDKISEKSDGGEKQ